MCEVLIFRRSLATHQKLFRNTNANPVPKICTREEGLAKAFWLPPFKVSNVSYVFYRGVWDFTVQKVS